MLQLMVNASFDGQFSMWCSMLYLMANTPLDGQCSSRRLRTLYVMVTLDGHTHLITRLDGQTDMMARLDKFDDQT